MPRTGRDLEIIRDAGATIVHCPLVSARGGRALESFARCRAMGMRLGMGTDTWPPDMLLNLQLGLMLCRVVEGDPAAVRAEDLFDAATIGGADAVGRSDLGRLQPGAAADMVVFDMGDDYIGRSLDPIQSLMVGTAGRRVTSVFVAGRVCDGERADPRVRRDGGPCTGAGAIRWSGSPLSRTHLGTPAGRDDLLLRLSGHKQLTDDANCRPRLVDLAAVGWRHSTADRRLTATCALG